LMVDDPEATLAPDVAFAADDDATLDPAVLFSESVLGTSSAAAPQPSDDVVLADTGRPVVRQHPEELPPAPAAVIPSTLPASARVAQTGAGSCTTLPVPVVPKICRSATIAEHVPTLAAPDVPWSPDKPMLPAARLVALRGASGAHDLASGFTLMVGRMATADVQLDNPKVSGRHFCIQRNADGECHLEDYSTNGTYVNTKIVGKGNTRLLNDRDEILIIPDENEGIQWIFLASPGSAGAPPVRAPEPSDEPAPKRAKTVEEPAEAPPPTQEDCMQELADEIECQICQDILYKVVAVTPCLHNFCSPCLSKWLGAKKGACCPTCRAPIEDSHRNHTVENFVSKLLEKRPEKKRAAEELASLDSANTLASHGFSFKAWQSATKGKGKGKGLKFTFAAVAASEEESDESGSHGSGSDSSELSGSDSEVDNATLCFACSAPDATGFRCDPDNRQHIRCCVCHERMPNRVDDNLPGGPQECVLCSRRFCSPYRSHCPAVSLSGAHAGWVGNPLLRRLSSTTLTAITPAVFNGIVFEQDVLAEHLASQSKTLETAFKEGLHALKEKGSAVPLDGPVPDLLPTHFTEDAALCRDCTVRVSVPALYEYMRAVPADQLPERIRRRRECWYGMNCRTAKHNPMHAARLNHVCPQTR